MIEIVTFGAGFRLDGPNWGTRAAPSLENDWRRLPPGIHIPPAPFSDPTYQTKILALSDGRGRMRVEVDPHITQMLEDRGATSLLQLGRMLTEGEVRLEQDHSFEPILNGSIGEVQRARTLDAAYGSLRLMGLVRYNPEPYTPRA